MSEPRPEPDSEVAGESEYGNDTGFAAEATGPAAGPDSSDTAAGSAGSDAAGPAGSDGADADTAGPAAGSDWAGPTGSEPAGQSAEQPAAGPAPEDADDDPGRGAD